MSLGKMTWTYFRQTYNADVVDKSKSWYNIAHDQVLGTVASVV